jgi:hypothetical protein
MYYHNGHPVGGRACFSNCNFGIFILDERAIDLRYLHFRWKLGASFMMGRLDELRM